MITAPVEHPFAQYVRILGRGKKGARSLSEAEAYEAMRMILASEVEDVQLGAFLMLLRVKEESPEELAGFVRAARDSLTLPTTAVDVQLDWASYAGKRRQLPWFLLSALLLAENGLPVLMHSTHGNKDNRVYTPDVINLFNIPVCASLAEANTRIASDRFAYIALESICPRLKAILNLREYLGLRSPINTLLRMLNPLNAPYLMQGTFHPAYRELHQQAALLLQQPHMAVIKGEGGETERNPDADCEVFSVSNGVAGNELWPAMFSGPRHLKDEAMDAKRLLRVWQGNEDDEYGIAAVTGTLAIALKLTGRANSIADAERLASELWASRPTQKYPLA